MLSISTEEIAALASRVSGPVFARDSKGLAAEVSGQNLLIIHDPDVAVGAATENDVVEAVRFASDHALAVNVQATGHGTHAAYDSGLIITTRRIDDVTIDPATRTASIGAGARWSAVVAAAAPHGLAPITGSSTGVGVVGFLLGGGVGPLARSHGFGSDWLREVRIVTADGKIRTASSAENPDLFWAIRGGKTGFGVITSVTVELAPISELYAGALWFDAPHIDTALHTWSAWAATAPDNVTTSAALVRMPPLEVIPEPLRGRRLLAIRFAYPGPDTDGERIAAPLRDAAPIYIDALGPMPLENVAQIYNDPDEPSPIRGWTKGYAMGKLDASVIARTLESFGPNAESPFMIAEFRHLGAAAGQDVADGSAVGGRSCDFLFLLLGISSQPITDVFADYADAFTATIAGALLPETTINFAGDTDDDDVYARSWSSDAFARLTQIREQYDPARIFPSGVHS
ncbi:MAG: FAD-binding oxidoreductase [Microbacterium sp.]|uniref:FAD-binding oxidoreductase n=1 Tax=Microbacterium sp. TaxID=51671 RepID=UPI003F989EE2